MGGEGRARPDSSALPPARRRSRAQLARRGVAAVPAFRYESPLMRNLDLALIGNGAIGLLIDASGSVVWGCFPRFDGDATFCALLDDAAPNAERGIWSIDLVDLARAEQSYVANTAVLTTRLFDTAGGAIEITDCVPRFAQFGRVFHPVSLVRHIRKISGSPRIVVRLRPAVDFGG